eukprot:6189042-Pleurochrysis_carterae.AAC.5
MPTEHTKRKAIGQARSSHVFDMMRVRNGTCLDHSRTNALCLSGRAGMRRYLRANRTRTWCAHLRPHVLEAKLGMAEVVTGFFEWGAGGCSCARMRNELRFKRNWQQGSSVCARE